MAIVPAYHSALESDRKVYHDSSLCTEAISKPRTDGPAPADARAASGVQTAKLGAR